MEKYLQQITIRHPNTNNKNFSFLQQFEKLESMAIDFQEPADLIDATDNKKTGLFQNAQRTSNQRNEQRQQVSLGS